MAEAKDRNYVGIGFWFVQWIVMGIPILNIIMLFVWAFSGDNESRKNYFKAMLIWMVISLALTAVLLCLGAIPFIVEFIRQNQPATR